MNNFLKPKELLGRKTLQYTSRQFICKHREVNYLIGEENMISADEGKEAGHAPSNVCAPMSVICLF